MENDFFADLLKTIQTRQLVTILIVFMTDFFSGICAAKVQGQEIESKKWINGLLRKSQIFLMLFCIGLITTLLHYPILYECFFWLFVLGEIKSIFENAAKINIPYTKEISALVDNSTEHWLKKLKKLVDNFNENKKD